MSGTAPVRLKSTPCERPVRRPLQTVAEPARGVADDPAVLEHDPQRERNASVFAPPSYCLQIDVRILCERRADIRRDDRGEIVRRAIREQVARARQHVAENRALRDDDRDQKHHETEADAEVKAAEHEAIIARPACENAGVELSFKPLQYFCNTFRLKWVA